MEHLATRVSQLSEAQAGLLRAADSVGAEQWKLRPAEGRWSAAEVIAHLISVERAIVTANDRNVQNPPRRVPFLKRFHLPMALASSRMIRVKTPIALDPQLVRAKEEMLAELREVRERTLAFLEETEHRDLSHHTLPHPFLGVLDTYEWIAMIAAHQVRHTKQMKEIAAGLPKAVFSSQK